MKTKANELAEAFWIDRDMTGAAPDHIDWARARALCITRYWSGEDAPPERYAEARVLWSDSALHVSFACRQAEPLVVSPAPRLDRKTLGLWDRDVCELFVAPDAWEPHRYFEFEVAPTGEWVDLAVEWSPTARRTDWDFASGMSASARVDGGATMSAVHVPWAALGGKPPRGALWRANFYRCVGAGASRGYLAWQPTHTPEPGFHAPDKFGWLRFGE